MTVGSSIIISRKAIQEQRLGGAFSTVYSSCGKIKSRPSSPGFHLEEKARRPLGIVRFFELADVGLSLDALSVQTIAPLSRLGRAGLLKGDRFVSIDGTEAKDAEAVRRLLRKRFALGGVGTFVVKRDGKMVTLRARLADEGPLP